MSVWLAFTVTGFIRVIDNYTLIIQGYGNDRGIEERTKDCVGVYDRKETGTYKRRRYAGDGRFMRHRTGQTSRGGLHGDIQ